MPIPAPERTPAFAVGDVVVHLKKHDRYIVDRIPGQALMQIDDKWLPAYRYHREDKPDGLDEEFTRTQEDFERSFVHVQFAPARR